MEDLLMINKLNTNAAQNPYKFSNQSANANRNDRRNPDFSNVDRIDISIDALRASKLANVHDGSNNETEEPEESMEQILEEYNNSGAVSKTDSKDDTISAEARRKMTAMKIAMRISKGDNVPMQDHRFLAEFDANLYKAALKASLTADNDDPETHESLADELAATEAAIANRASLDSEVDTDDVTDEVTESSVVPEGDELE